MGDAVTVLLQTVGYVLAGVAGVVVGLAVLFPFSVMGDRIVDHFRNTGVGHVALLVRNAFLFAVLLGGLYMSGQLVVAAARGMVPHG